MFSVGSPFNVAAMLNFALTSAPDCTTPPKVTVKASVLEMRSATEILLPVYSLGMPKPSKYPLFASTLVLRLTAKLNEVVPVNW